MTEDIVSKIARAARSDAYLNSNATALHELIARAAIRLTAEAVIERINSSIAIGSSCCQRAENQAAIDITLAIRTTFLGGAEHG